MAYPGNYNDSTPLGEKASYLVLVGRYYTGTPGSIALPVGGGCPESRAIEAGGAVTLVVSDFACQKVQGIRIKIGDTAESIHSGFEMVNMNFHTSGTSAVVANNFNMGAPIAT